MEKANQQKNQQGKKPKSSDAKKDGAQPQQAVNRNTIVRPMLPQSYDRMLKCTGPDKSLECIQVNFYPHGMYEMKFVANVVGDNGEPVRRVLQPGEYQNLRNTLARPQTAVREEEASLAFFKKLRERCWIKCDDVSYKNSLRIKALIWPPPVMSAFSLTQKDIKSGKLSAQRMFSIWKELKPQAKAEVERFQHEVDPTFKWSDTIASYALFVEKRERDEAEKKLQEAKQAATSAGVTLQGGTHPLTKGQQWADIPDDDLLPNPFEDFRDHEDDEEDSHPGKTGGGGTPSGAAPNSDTGKKGKRTLASAVMNAVGLGKTDQQKPEGAEKAPTEV